MIDKSDNPNLFMVPIGCEFSTDFLSGLFTRLPKEPEALARVTIFVNTARMQRRMMDLFIQKGALLLPKILLITQLSNDPFQLLNLPKANPPLQRKLQLAQLVRALLHKDKTVAPLSAMFELTESLTALLDEAQGEGVSLSSIKGLDLNDQSGHWVRSQEFLSIIAEHWDQNQLTDSQDRMRFVALEYAKIWSKVPPEHPIIIAGSTGSRGETAEFMKVVAKLPNGAVVLPGFDVTAPDTFWDSLSADTAAMDHPQSGFAKLLRKLEISAKDIRPWHEGSMPKNPARNSLISLAMRPAPITDQWLTEGPNHTDTIDTAIEGVTLIEAPNQKLESLAIATAIRKSVKDQKPIVLITPSRELSRRVTNALVRWGIEPDDSAGRPLHLSPCGLFLRLVIAAIGQATKAANLLSILKHPLTHMGNGRSQHILDTQNLELNFLRGRGPVVDAKDLQKWFDESSIKTNGWITWLTNIIAQSDQPSEQPLSVWVSRHKKMAEIISLGSSQISDLSLWEGDDGKAALALFEELEANAKFSGLMSASEYQALFRGLLNQELRPERPTANSLVSIWGTLEARVQSASRVILAGLNEGTWPSVTNFDMWLNRNLRKQLGLLVPERQIGLSAHDFQQAMGTSEVILSRALTDAGTPTTASRWIIRLSNLMNGLGEEGEASLTSMKFRGQYWLDLGQNLEATEKRIDPSTRPSPIPPKDARPKRLSVTKIRTLVADPYEIYALEVLKLRKLQPIGKEADALDRGTIIHKIIELFTKEPIPNNPDLAQQAFLQIANEVLNADVPWPTARRMWLARLARVAAWFVRGEQERLSKGAVAAIESKGIVKIDELDFTLSTKADRIDRGIDGLRIYDYKAGKPPSKGEIEHFNKQLELEAIIAQMGGFENVGPTNIEFLEYVGLDTSQQTTPLERSEDDLEQIWAEFISLITHYRDETNGFTARDKKPPNDYTSNYEHLSRFGEWLDSDEPDPQVVP